MPVWSLSAASYDSVLKSVTAQNTAIRAVHFKPDGTKMYVFGQTGGRVVYQYTLSTPWVVSSATYDSVSFSVATQDAAARNITFSADGTKMYMSGDTGKVWQYTLSAAWNLATASYASKNLDLTANGTQPYGIAFSADGSKFYNCESSTDTVYQWTLSTAWDVSTGTYASLSKSVTTEDTNPRSIVFKSDGTKMFMAGDDNNSIRQYALSTAWNISTASLEASFGVGTQDGNPIGLFIKPNGAKMYVAGLATATVYQYTLGSVTLDLSAALAAAAAFTPTVKIERKASATLAATATVTPHAIAVRNAAATVNASSSVAAALRSLRYIQGSITTGSTLAGSVELLRSLRATLAATATVSGSTDLARMMNATLAAQAIVTAGASASRRVSAVVTPQAALTAQVTLERFLHAIVTGGAEASGRVGIDLFVSARVNPVATVAATLLAVRFLRAELSAAGWITDAQDWGRRSGTQPLIHVEVTNG